MPKKRMNVTVDEPIYEELQARDDINVSGLVNSFLKRYLRGEATDNAAEKLRAERLEREAQEKMEEAQSLKNQAQSIRQQFEQQREEEEKKWKEAVNVLGGEPGPLADTNEPSEYDYQISPDENGVEYWADELDMPVQEFCERFPDKYKIHFECDSQTTENHHYQ